MMLAAPRAVAKIPAAKRDRARPVLWCESNVIAQSWQPGDLVCHRYRIEIIVRCVLVLLATATEGFRVISLEIAMTALRRPYYVQWYAGKWVFRA